jgi:hypothetical protein
MTIYTGPVSPTFGASYHLVTGPDNKLWFTENSASKLGTVIGPVSSYLRSDDPTQSITMAVGQSQISPQDGNVHIEDPVDFRQSMPT